MKKIILLNFILIIIIGCDYLSDGGPTATISDLDIHKGTNGLVITPIKNSPPEEVYEGEEFPVYVQLENQGAADITNGYLTLGFQKDYLESQSTGQEFSLNGKSLVNPKGEKKIFRFIMSAKDIIGESRDVPITISSCYSYNTLATIPVCIDTDVYNIKAVDKACSVSDITLKNGQGGPIEITEIQPKMLTSEGENNVIPQFAIKVENSQNGDVIRTANTRDLCSASELSKDNLYVVEVTAQLSEQTLQCNKDILNLEDGEDEIVCKLESGISKDQASYTTLMQVRLDYGYHQTITNSIVINKRI